MNQPIAQMESYRLLQPEDGSVRAKGANLYAKMIAIVSEVGRVPKNGRNTTLNYDFVRESDIVDAINRGCYTHNVSIRFAPVRDSVEYVGVETSRGSRATEVKLWERMIVTNCDDPAETFTEEFPGVAQDSGDKGLWKAMTGARKYALISTFMVSTGDDPEHPGAGDGPSDPADDLADQARAFVAAKAKAQRKPKAPPAPPAVAPPEESKVQPMSQVVPGEPISAKQKAYIEKKMPLWVSATMSERQMFVSQATNGRVRDLDQTTQEEAERVYRRLESFDPTEEMDAALNEFDSLPKEPPKKDTRTETLASTLQAQAQALKRSPVPEQTPQPIDDDVLRSLAGNVSMQDMRELAYMAGECGMGENGLRAVVREVTKRDMLTSGTVGKVRAYLEQRREVEEA